MTTSLSASQRVLCALALLWALLPGTAIAQKPENVTAGEIALLPTYCGDTMGLRPGAESGSLGPGARKWIALMGPSFRHMHHHCWALINERRARSAGATGFYRDGLLARVVADNQYVIANSEPGFIMLPEVYLKMGDGQLLLKRYALAFDAYAEAARRKPDYWRVYDRWAEALVAAGSPKAALATLEEGLRRAGNHAALRDRYKRLGGNLDKFLLTLPPPTAPSAPSAASAPSALPAASAASTGG